jgi:hypothetical protein
VRSPGQDHRESDGTRRAHEDRSARSIGASRSARPSCCSLPWVKDTLTDTPLTRRRSVRAGALSARWPSEERRDGRRHRGQRQGPVLRRRFYQD